MTADDADIADFAEMIHEKLSGEIIGASMHVFNRLKPGLDEKLYERALSIELQRRGHGIEVQREYSVFYEAELIGSLRPDLIVDNLIIVDPKVVTAFNDAHIAQMVGYLSVTGLELALLLNFKSARLDWKRVIRQRKRDEDPPNLHA